MVDLEVLLRGKGKLLFQSKMGMVCIVYGEISEGSGAKSPLNPPFVIEVAKVGS